MLFWLACYWDNQLHTQAYVAPKTQTTLDTKMAHSASNHPKTTPGTHYADGTGDMLIDRLNESQLDQNYKGSAYYLGSGLIL